MGGSLCRGLLYHACQVFRKGENLVPCRRKFLRLRGLRDGGERVGFVPDEPAFLNDLGRSEPPETTRSARTLSIRYKTGTAAITLQAHTPAPGVFFPQQHGSAMRSHSERAGRRIREQWAGSV